MNRDHPIPAPASWARPSMACNGECLQVSGCACWFGVAKAPAPAPQPPRPGLTEDELDAANRREPEPAEAATELGAGAGADAQTDGADAEVLAFMAKFIVAVVAALILVGLGADWVLQ